MEFTIQDIVKLYTCANEYERIRIEGINHYGQEFKTSGFILSYTNDDGDPLYISNRSIGVYFGQKKKYKGKKYEMFATFYTTYKGNYDALYISRILDSRGREIFVNNDFRQIESQVMANLNEDELSSTAQYLTHFIAKPIIAYGQKCVLKGVHMVDGVPYIDATTGPGYHGTIVMANENVVLDTDALNELDRIDRLYGGHQKKSLN